MIDNHIGKIIKSFSHCQHWCLDQKQPILIRKNNELIRYSWKAIARTPFGQLNTMMENNRLFEFI